MMGVRRGVWEVSGMSEQPNDLVVEQVEVERPEIHHEHVRTEGETSVDDAIGASDEPG